MRLSRKTTGVQDMCGPATLRSALVSSTAASRDNELEVVALLGQGAYGMVHRMQEKDTGQCRVLKTVVRPEGWDDQRLKMEAEILQNLDHPHILRIFSWFEDGDAVNIVMEHCEGGELLHVVRTGRKRGETLPEPWAATGIKHVLEALVYIHSKGVVHKDLKGQNLLLLHSTESEDGRVFENMPHVVVCDLGIAEICCRGIFGLRGKKVAGTPATMAPEVWTGNCSPKSDVWSMGCVVFEIFTNRLPFEVVGNIQAAAKQQSKWLELHKKGPNWDLMMRSSEAVKNLCQQMLTFKEGSRPSAGDCLKHAWMQLAKDEELTQEEVASLCSAVCSWQSRSAMQRALCLKLAVGCTCISKFARIFSKFDTDNSGILERAEVVAALQSLGIDKQTAKKTAAALDVNGDNSCEYLEFAAACLLSLEEQFDELLRQEFRSLDVRRKGCLTDKEFAPLMEELKKLASSRGLELEELDADGNGVIDFEEFCTYFGRPGTIYYNDPRLKTGSESSTNGGKKRAMLPMKEHIRLVGGRGSTVEYSMEQIRQSMEEKERPAKPAKKLESVKELDFESEGSVLTKRASSMGRAAPSTPSAPSRPTSPTAPSPSSSPGPAGRKPEPEWPPASAPATSSTAPAPGRPPPKGVVPLAGGSSNSAVQSPKKEDNAEKDLTHAASGGGVGHSRPSSATKERAGLEDRIMERIRSHSITEPAAAVAADQEAGLRASEYAGLSGSWENRHEAELGQTAQPGARAETSTVPSEPNSNPRGRAGVEAWDRCSNSSRGSTACPTPGDIQVQYSPLDPAEGAEEPPGPPPSRPAFVLRPGGSVEELKVGTSASFLQTSGGVASFEASSCPGCWPGGPLRGSFHNSMACPSPLRGCSIQVSL